VPQPLVICLSCRCHVRIGETACPHCGANLTESGAKRAPIRRSFEIRRVFYATAALAGLGAASCGGRISGEDTGSASAASRLDIMGGCMLQDGAVSPCALPTMGTPGLWHRPPDACQCGPAGTCSAGACVAIDCGDGYYVDSSGQCHAVYWFAGNLPNTGGCYGAPPFLG
jgi:hypothetical protein